MGIFVVGGDVGAGVVGAAVGEEVGWRVGFFLKKVSIGAIVGFVGGWKGTVVPLLSTNKGSFDGAGVGAGVVCFSRVGSTNRK